MPTHLATIWDALADGHTLTRALTERAHESSAMGCTGRVKTLYR